jgi:hypothetical protein
MRISSLVLVLVVGSVVAGADRESGMSADE